MAASQNIILILRLGMDKPEAWKEAIAQAGFRPEYALTQRQALEEITDPRVCAVICGHRPPAFSADAFIGHVEAARSGLPVLVCAHPNHKGDGDSLKSAGAQEIPSGSADQSPRAIIEQLARQIDPEYIHRRPPSKKGLLSWLGNLFSPAPSASPRPPQKTAPPKAAAQKQKPSPSPEPSTAAPAPKQAATKAAPPTTPAPQAPTLSEAPEVLLTSEHTPDRPAPKKLAPQTKGKATPPALPPAQTKAKQPEPSPKESLPPADLGKSKAPALPAAQTQTHRPQAAHSLGSVRISLRTVAAFVQSKRAHLPNRSSVRAFLRTERTRKSQPLCADSPKTAQAKPKHLQSLPQRLRSRLRLHVSGRSLRSLPADVRLWARIPAQIQPAPLRNAPAPPATTGTPDSSNLAPHAHTPHSVPPQPHSPRAKQPVTPPVVEAAKLPTASPSEPHLSPIANLRLSQRHTPNAQTQTAQSQPTCRTPSARLPSDPSDPILPPQLSDLAQPQAQPTPAYGLRESLLLPQLSFVPLDLQSERQPMLERIFRKTSESLSPKSKEAPEPKDTTRLPLIVEDSFAPPAQLLSGEAPMHTPAKSASKQLQPSAALGISALSPPAGAKHAPLPFKAPAPLKTPLDTSLLQPTRSAHGAIAVPEASPSEDVPTPEAAEAPSELIGEVVEFDDGVTASIVEVKAGKVRLEGEGFSEWVSFEELGLE